jgi:hypothetical protein
MARTTVTFTIDQRAVDLLIEDVGTSSARRAAQRTRDRARQNLAAAGRIDTGDLSRSIGYWLTRRSGRVVSFDVGSPLDYAGHQEHGTRGSVARPGHYLRFKPKGSNVFIFRKRVQGFPGAHYLRDAINSVSASDFAP